MAWSDEFGLDLDVLDFPPSYTLTSASRGTLEIRDECGKIVVRILLLLPVGRTSAENFGHVLERLAWKTWVKPETKVPVLKFGLAEPKRQARNHVDAFLVRAGALVLAAAISIFVLRTVSLDQARVGMPLHATDEVKTQPAPAVRYRPQRPKAFRISFGQFRRREFAEAHARVIRRMGYVPVVGREGPWFVVMSRAYKARRDAERWARIFTTIGLRAHVVAMRENSATESLY